jgi:hypothetical protein
MVYINPSAGTIPVTNGKLTVELFEAGGIAVTEAPAPVTKRLVPAADSGFSEAVLDELAKEVRCGHAAVQQAVFNALNIAFDVGATLLAARDRISTGWIGWLQDCCKLNRSTAHLYMRLAAKRDEIEAVREQTPDLSLRAAYRLITKRSSEESSEESSEGSSADNTFASNKPDPVASVVTVLRALDDAVLTKVWTAFTLAPFLRTIPADMRSELERRIAGLRPATKASGPVLLRESEILRQAVGHMRIATARNTAPADMMRAEEQAFLALRMFTKALAKLDIDRITITDVYAKESRCAEERGRKGKRRRAA